MSSLKDVAEKAGVSLSTASRAIRRKPGLSEETYNKILQIAKELNYKPNPSARLLAGKRSHIIGIIDPELRSPYFTALIQEVEMQVKARGYYLLIVNSDFEREKELEALQTLETFKVDGVFLPSSSHPDVLQFYINELTQNGIKFVGLESLIHDDNYSYIHIDDTWGITQAIAHLLKTGKTRICFLSDFLNDELRGPLYRQALINNNLSPDEYPIFSHPSDRHEKAGYEIMKEQILTLPPDKRPNGIIAGYDDLAVGAMRAIKEANLSVPEDFSIIGNDNIPSAPYLHKALTTLAPPIREMAELGSKILIDQIEGKMSPNTVNHIILKPQLIIRETG